MTKIKTVTVVKDETVRPTPDTFPPLLHTLQTYMGTVENDGKPHERVQHVVAHHGEVAKRAADFRRILQPVSFPGRILSETRYRLNLQACAAPVSKDDLIEYIRHGKRIDLEQAVAMAVGYIAHSAVAETSKDSFEDHDKGLVEELLSDRGTLRMLGSACTWRTGNDFELLGDSRNAAKSKKKQIVLRLAGLLEANSVIPSDHKFCLLLQRVRRRRAKLGDRQHLVFPPEMLPSDMKPVETWELSNSYQLRQTSQEPPAVDEPWYVSKIKFRRIQSLLEHLQEPRDPTEAYCLEVDRFVADSGALAPRRVKALEKSEDAAAIAYSFVAAQRRLQKKVVSDQEWTRFLAKGEGGLLLQNRPDVLTSFEDSLVRRATDLVALTAIACPKGVRDHFSQIGDITARARRCCELMEKYVTVFGGGRFEKLVFAGEWDDGGKRGPVDFYNRLVDEVRDCNTRARNVGADLKMGRMYKFLAKDIMAWSDAWKDDAFADGKVPGWVEYLMRVRAEEITLD